MSRRKPWIPLILVGSLFAFGILAGPLGVTNFGVVCFHDWEVVDITTKSEVENSLLSLTNDFLVLRVCLDCGKIDDQITKHKVETEEKRRVSHERKAKAKKILKKERQ